MFALEPSEWFLMLAGVVLTGFLALLVWHDCHDQNNYENQPLCAQRASQFIVGMSAPTSGTIGDGMRSGPRSLGGESGPDFYTLPRPDCMNFWSLFCDLGRS